MYDFPFIISIHSLTAVFLRGFPRGVRICPYYGDSSRQLVWWAARVRIHCQRKSSKYSFLL